MPKNSDAIFLARKNNVWLALSASVNTKSVNVRSDPQSGSLIALAQTAAPGSF